MPAPLIKALVKETGKSKQDVEAKWQDAKSKATKENPDNKWALANYILHKELKAKDDELEEENEEALRTLANLEIWNQAEELTSNDTTPEESEARKKALEKLKREEKIYNTFGKYTDKWFLAKDKPISMDSWAGDSYAASNKVSVGETKRDIDSNGYLHVEGCVLTGEQVAPYLGKELDKTGSLGLDKDKIYGVYRPAEEVKKAADTFNGIPLTDGHIYITPENPHKNRWIGSTGTDSKFDTKENNLFNSVHIHDGKAIRAIERADNNEGGKKDLSCGYTYDLIPEEGNFNGKPYHFKMVNIKGNHLALVEDGRHEQAAIADDNTNIKGKTMSKKSWVSSILGRVFAADKKTNKSVIFDTISEIAARDASEFEGGVVEQASVIIAAVNAYDEADIENETERAERSKMSIDKKAKDEDEEEKDKEAKDEGEEETEKKAKDKKARDAKKAKDKKAKDEDEDEEEKAEDDEEEVEKEKAMDAAIRARNSIIATAKKVIGMSDKFVETASIETIIDNALTKNNINTKGRAFDSKVAMLEVLASTKEQAKPKRRVATDTKASTYVSLINRK